MCEDDAAFANRLFRSMRAVARDAGHPSAYPDTPEGRLAALRQQLPPLYRVVPLTTSRRPLAAWARCGWRPYQRWRHFGWSDGDLTSTDPPEEEAP
jgi:hypothetical protein